MKILIVRHGDPDYSIDSLTEQGKVEAELLSKKLCGMDFKEIYVSPLGRARATAEYTLKKLGREGIICDWLREFAPKIARPDREESIAWDWYPEDWAGVDGFFNVDKWAEHPVMAEGKVKEEYDWVCNELDKVLAKHGYEREGRVYKAVRPNEDTIVFFCHFGLESVLLSHLLNISPMQIWHGFCAAPSSVTTLVTEERRKGTAYFRMGSFGDTSHLYVAGVEPSFSARFCETFDNKNQRHD